MTGAEWIAAFLGVYMNVNVAMHDAFTGWKELCEGFGGVYAPSEQLFERSGNLQYWGCFGADVPPPR